MNGCDCGRYVDGRLIVCAVHPRPAVDPSPACKRGTLAERLARARGETAADAVTQSLFTRNALAGTLPAKDLTR